MVCTVESVFTTVVNVDAAVDRAVLADAVEDHDGIVHGETDDRQQRCQEKRVDFPGQEKWANRASRPQTTNTSWSMAMTAEITRNARHGPHAEGEGDVEIDTDGRGDDNINRAFGHFSANGKADGVEAVDGDFGVVGWSSSLSTIWAFGSSSICEEVMIKPSVPEVCTSTSEIPNVGRDRSLLPCWEACPGAKGDIQDRTPVKSMARGNPKDQSHCARDDDQQGKSERIDICVNDIHGLLLFGKPARMLGANSNYRAPNAGRSWWRRLP